MYKEDSNAQLESFIVDLEIDRMLQARLTRAITLLIVVCTGMGVLWFLFCGSGLAFFFPEVHRFVVEMLLHIPGEHQSLVLQDINADGYVSARTLQHYLSMLPNDLNRIQ